MSSNLKDRLVTDGLNQFSTAPMVNALAGAQFGPTTNFANLTQNSHYISRNVIARVVTFPKWVEYMEHPEVYKAALKNFIEVQSRIEGLNAGLTAEFARTPIGPSGAQQADVTQVLETQSEVVHTVTEKLGMYFATLFDHYIRYGMMDPHTQRPLVSVVNDKVVENGIDLYSMSVMYYEPDPLQKFVNKAWLIMNMVPNGNGDIAGRKDPEAAGETMELAITFTGVQDTSYGTKLLAQKDLDGLNAGGLREALNPYTAKASIEEIDADVAATKTGFNNMMEEAKARQID